MKERFFRHRLAGLTGLAGGGKTDFIFFRKAPVDGVYGKFGRNFTTESIDSAKLLAF